MMGQMFSYICPLFMSQTGVCVLIAGLLVSPAVFGQASKPALPSADRAIKLAQHGHCEEAVPALKRASQSAAEKGVKRTAAFAGVRCAMLLNQTGAAVDF